MDLDKLKKTWQETNITPKLDESSIEKMLNNQGKGAIAALLHTEKLFFKLLIISCLLGCLLEFSNRGISIFFICLLIPGSAWAIYKIKILKQMDPLGMGILEIAKSIAKFKKALIWEICAGILIVPIFAITYVQFLLRPDSLSEEGFDLTKIAMTIGFIVIVAAICIPIYKNMYFKNIKTIEESIKEIKYFENEN